MTNARANRNKLAFALGIGAAGVSAMVAACSSGSSNDGAKTSADGGATEPSSLDGGAPPLVDAGAVSTQPGSCPNPTIPIVFSPMYSAFIPGSTAQTFAIPAVTADGNAATWSLSDPTQGHLQLQSFESGGVLAPGVLITVEGTGNDAGQVTVVASEGSAGCGSAMLTLTQNTVDDWNIGNTRYNDGVSLHLGRPAMGDGGPPAPRPDGGSGGTFEDGGLGGGGFGDGGFAVLLPRTEDGGSYYETDGGTACTNCHGPTATNGPYKTVSHTPEQTGGFSDTDLQNIIWNGEVPDGGYFDPSVLIASCDGGPTCTAQARALWHSFHRWTDITSDELPGVICYLRSLTPEAQNGTANFGGAVGRRRDGGGAP
jgi:hypothetical protein